MATNKFHREIKKILNNNFRKDLKGNQPKSLSPEQIKLLKKYKQFYEAKKSSKGGIVKTSSVWNALICLRQLGVYLEKPYQNANKEELVGFFTKYLKGKSEATKSAWKVCVRSFYKWKENVNIEKKNVGIVKENKEIEEKNIQLEKEEKPLLEKKQLIQKLGKSNFPDVVFDERLEPTRAEPRKVSPDDLFTKDDVLKLLEACYNPMDKAIVSIWYEMGLRASEYVSANVGSVVPVSGGCKFFVEESKTETGFVPLIQSAPYLEEWKQVHPYKNDLKAPLFIAMKRRKKGQKYRRLQPNGINQKLKRICERAGIKKKIYTHLGRNISITRLDGTLAIEDNARLHGISPATVLNVYTRRSRKEATKKYFDKFGKEKTDKEKITEKKEKEKLLPKECENCGHSNPFDQHFCKKCLRPIDIMTFLELDKRRSVRDVVVKGAVEKGRPLTQGLVTDIIREMKDSGEIKELLREMIKSGEV